jgi:hypothetical protein
MPKVLAHMKQILVWMLIVQVSGIDNLSLTFRVA